MGEKRIFAFRGMGGKRIFADYLFFFSGQAKVKSFVNVSEEDS